MTYGLCEWNLIANRLDERKFRKLITWFNMWYICWIYSDRREYRTTKKKKRKKNTAKYRNLFVLICIFAHSLAACTKRPQQTRGNTRVDANISYFIAKPPLHNPGGNVWSIFLLQLKKTMCVREQGEWLQRTHDSVAHALSPTIFHLFIMIKDIKMNAWLFFTCPLPHILLFIYNDQRY